MVQELAVVGKRLPLKDAYQKVTGTFEYAIDMSVPGMLYGKILRSPRTHARITRIDTSRAEALPGVHAVITYRDVPKEEWMAPSFNYRGPVLQDVVRFHGDEVAAVAAVDERTADQALDLIEVEYEDLPHVFDPLEAMKPDAPQVRPDGNVRNPLLIEWGDLDAGFRDADLVVEASTTLGGQQAAPLGRNACIAGWNGNNLTVWTSTQTPSQVRDIIAKFLGLPLNQVRVISTGTGPSFGLWWLNNFHMITVFLAKKARRPVKLELTQEECIATVKRRHVPFTTGRLGIKRDGQVTALDIRHIFDNGAYGNKFEPFQSVTDLWGRIPSGRFEMIGVATNRLTAACMRGVGDIEINICTERLLDLAAEAIGMDPVEIRIANCFRTGDPIHSTRYRYTLPLHGVQDRDHGIKPPERITISSVALQECLKRGAEAFGWNDKWKGWGRPVAVEGQKRRGVGVSVAAHVSGVNALGTASTVVNVNQDGSVYFFTSIGRMGQGPETTQAQVIAEELGVPFESVAGLHGDTEACPWAPPTYGSTAAHICSLASRAAARDAKRQILELAAPILEANPDDLDIKNARIFVKGSPERGIPLTRVTAWPMQRYLSPPLITGRGWSNAPNDVIAKISMAHFVEVEVDTETGKVSILKFVAAHDSGTLINPAVCENQVYGGIYLGAGLGLAEDLCFDPETGAVLNTNFIDYKVLSALDMPDPTALFVEVTDPIGVWGAKAIGEGAACPATTAVSQAVYNAIGKWIIPPITAIKVLQALGTIE